MNLLDILPIQNEEWNILNNDISLERLSELYKVYIMVKKNDSTSIYTGKIKELNESKLLLEEKNNQKVEINLNDIIGIEDISTNSISPFFGLSIYDYISDQKSFKDVINAIKQKLKQGNMFVNITNKNLKNVYAILEDIDDNFIYYTIKYKLNNEILVSEFKLDLDLVYNIEKAHLASLFENIEPINYLKNTTNYLTIFKEEDIKDIKADMYNKFYILLKNGDLYISDKDLKISNVKEIYSLDYADIFGITNDKKIISFNNKIYQDYFKDYEYDKIITYTFGIVALKDNKVKIVLNFEVTSGLDYENFIDVEDIKIDDKEIYVKKNQEWKKLFIN